VSVMKYRSARTTGADGGISRETCAEVVVRNVAKCRFGLVFVGVGDSLSHGVDVREAG